MSAPITARRGFLSGLVSLPLIGGGVTLIGKPTAAAVPLVDAVAAPNLMQDPRARARYAWEAFAVAMREVTAGAPGWCVRGGEQLVTVGYMPATEPWIIAERVWIDPMWPEQPERWGLVGRREEVTL